MLLMQKLFICSPKRSLQLVVSSVVGHNSNFNAYENGAKNRCRSIDDISFRQLHSNSTAITKTKTLRNPQHHAFSTDQVSIAGNLSNNYGGSSNDKNKKKNQDRRSGKHHHRFIDRIRVRVAGGPGGNGSQSMVRISRKHKRRPDGGHGGNGGSVIIIADPNEQSLRWTRPHVTAEAGSHGSSQKKHGRNGKNAIIRVPCGVVVRRVLDYDEEWDEQTQTVRKIHQQQNNDHHFLENYYDDNLDSDHAGDPDSDSDDILQMAFDSDGYQYKDEEGNDAEWSKGDNLRVQNDFLRQGVKGRSPVLLSADESDDIFKDYLRDDDYGYDDHDHDHDHADLNINVGSDFHFVPWGKREKVDLADLDKPGSYVVVARGGRGGVGSSIFSNRHGPLPSQEILTEYAKPKEAEKAALELDLKLIADIGLVGFPNAGKSSLLAAMSRATPQIAPYPFTTINPIVGYIDYRDGYRVCAADVPGLIAGAAEGRGMGHDFLRHLERTKALLYIVDAAGVDGRDPVEDFTTLVQELKAYGGGDMLNRRALVVANKIDLLRETKKRLIMDRLAKVCETSGLVLQREVIGISAGVSGEGLAELSKAIRDTVLLSGEDMRKFDEAK